MTGRFFSGHESWVFRADTLEQLCGFHTELVGQVLSSSDALEYLLYSPLREASAGPFGLAGGSGSHALAVTRDRFIISRDPHQPQLPRSVREVPFASIVTVEVGEALTLGWFVVRFAAAGRLASETVFFQSSGINLFRDAVRVWRRNGVSVAAHDLSSSDRRGIWDHVPAYLRTQVEPLILEGEDPQAVLTMDETWSPATAHRLPTCLSAVALCIASNRGCLLVQSERPPRPGILVFAVNVTCVDRQAVRNIRIACDDSHPDLLTLVFELDSESVGRQVQLPLGRTPPEVVERFLADARRDDRARGR